MKMPNRWESSKRPLFIKTIYINGSRHAILSCEDPLVQPANFLSGKSSLSANFSNNFQDSCSESSEPNSEYVFEIIPKGHSGRNSGRNADLGMCLTKVRFATTADTKDRIACKKCLCDIRKSENETTLWETRSNKQKRKKLNQRKKIRMPDLENQQKQQRREEKLPDRIRDFCIPHSSEDDTEKVSVNLLKFNSSKSIFVGNSEKNWTSIKDYYFLEDNRKLGQMLDASLQLKQLNLMTNPVTGENICLPESFTHTEPYKLYSNSCSEAFNSSLTERVLHWIDLAVKNGKRKYSIPCGEDILLNKTEKTDKTLVKKVNPVNCQLKKISNGTENKQSDSSRADKENGLRIRDFDKYSRTNVKSHDGFIPVNLYKYNKESSTPAERIKQRQVKYFEDHFEKDAITRFTSKTDLNSVESINLENAIAKQLQSPHQCKKTILATEREMDARLAVACSCSQKNKFFTELYDSSCIRASFFNHARDELDEGKNNVNPMRFLEKQNEGVQTHRSKPKKEEIPKNDEKFKFEYITFSGKKNWMYEVGSTMNETSSSERNGFSESARKFNDLICLEQNKTWKSEKPLGRPQLHIFIPSLVFEAKEEESISDVCDSQPTNN